MDQRPVLSQQGMYHL